MPQNVDGRMVNNVDLWKTNLYPWRWKNIPLAC